MYCKKFKFKAKLMPISVEAKRDGIRRLLAILRQNFKHAKCDAVNTLRINWSPSKHLATCALKTNGPSAGILTKVFEIKDKILLLNEIAPPSPYYEMVLMSTTLCSEHVTNILVIFQLIIFSMNMKIYPNITKLFFNNTKFRLCLRWTHSIEIYQPQSWREDFIIRLSFYTDSYNVVFRSFGYICKFCVL